MFRALIFIILMSFFSCGNNEITNDSGPKSYRHSPVNDDKQFVDIGIFIDNSVTTEFGEIAPIETGKQLFSGDRFIGRNAKFSIQEDIFGENVRLRKESNEDLASIRYNYFLKFKAINPDLKEMPSAITISGAEIENCTLELVPNAADFATIYEIGNQSVTLCNIGLDLQAPIHRQKNVFLLPIKLQSALSDISINVIWQAKSKENNVCFDQKNNRIDCFFSITVKNISQLVLPNSLSTP